MKILAIDTSCDDTSVAVVEKKNNQIKAMSNIVSSQIKIHAPYGGIYPMLAKRAHQENLAPTLIQSLKKAGLLKAQSAKLSTRGHSTELSRGPQAEGCKAQSCNSKFKILNKILNRDPALLEKTMNFLAKYEKPAIDAIAITNGPGLEPCLWQGVNFAKALSFWWGLPLIPVNHIKAHLTANFISENSKKQETRNKQIQFPAIGLVASGGHTELILMKKQGDYKLIGSTRDDASGECFDKTARILGLPYPGGPAIAALAARFKIQDSRFKIELPRPMIKSNNFDFSFSGLKTAVLYDFQKREKKMRESQDYKILMAKEIQQAIIDVLIAKTLKAAKKFNAKSIITGGGVMANKELRNQLKVQSSKCKINFLVPPKNLCMDNAAMAGAEALISKPKVINPQRERATFGAGWQKIKVNGNLNI